ncbi:hypothetical protein [Stenotrophomonas rhizophila]|uniref:Uncharacterized protein n=1 Tax=Stenotrophomonas rhizophila TaxID=216778 RepID=A0A7V7YE69_9GAMM|nr:hypothetical protein [Stenotrophomonas rhizophila]KAB7629238.1 hypothetical protein F9K92_14095 [Stenotrophomonas rhizophila]
MKSVSLLLGLIAGTALGVLAGFWLGTKDQPRPIDTFTNQLATYVSLLYGTDGTPKDLQWTRDALALQMANTLVLAGSHPYGAAIPGNEGRLKAIAGRVLEQNLLADVKQQDARELAYSVAVCILRENPSDFCPTHADQIPR